MQASRCGRSAENGEEKAGHCVQDHRCQDEAQAGTENAEKTVLESADDAERPGQSRILFMRTQSDLGPAKPAAH